MLAHYFSPLLHQAIVLSRGCFLPRLHFSPTTDPLHFVAAAGGQSDTTSRSPPFVTDERSKLKAGGEGEEQSHGYVWWSTPDSVELPRLAVTAAVSWIHFPFRARSSKTRAHHQCWRSHCHGQDDGENPRDGRLGETAGLVDLACGCHLGTTTLLFLNVGGGCASERYGRGYVFLSLSNILRSCSTVAGYANAS